MQIIMINRNRYTSVLELEAWSEYEFNSFDKSFSNSNLSASLIVKCSKKIACADSNTQILYLNKDSKIYLLHYAQNNPRK